MARNMGFIGCSILLLAGTVGTTAATEYKAGDNFGWNVPPSENLYSDWARNKNFTIGDKLIFNLTGTHTDTVADVSKADYDNCNTAASASGSNLNGQVFQINLTHSGSRYFICTVGDHCARGQKFSIHVESAGGPAAQPPDSYVPTLSSFGLLSAILPTIAVHFFTTV